MAAFLPPAPPPGILAMPIRCYGISYDIMVNPTERNLPHGFVMGGTHIVVSLNPSNFPMSAVAERSHWFLLLESTYRQLIRTLQTNGFFRRQYSDYNNPFVPAWFAWATMFALGNIQPPGKMESTVGGLKSVLYSKGLLTPIFFLKP